MTPTPYTGVAALAREATRIARHAPQTAHGLWPLIVLTDPVRLPDPVHLAKHLPMSCTLIYRHFGDPNAQNFSAEASAICKIRGLSFLVSCDSGVPPGLDAGVHFPEHRHDAIKDWRKAMPGRTFTAAAHSKNAAKTAFAAGVDAVLLSPVFETSCDGAGTALGIDEFSRISKTCAAPVYALGGITATNARTLRGLAAGIAVVGGVLA